MQKKLKMQSWRNLNHTCFRGEYFQNFNFLYCHLLQVSYFFLSPFWLFIISKKIIHLIKIFQYFHELYALFLINYLHSLLISSLYFLVCIFFSHFPSCCQRFIYFCCFSIKKFNFQFFSFCFVICQSYLHLLSPYFCCPYSAFLVLFKTLRLANRLIYF